MARLQHRQTVDPVVQARRAFFESGRAPAGYVPPAILQSWRRCLGLGLAVNARPSIEPVDAPAIAHDAVVDFLAVLHFPREGGGFGIHRSLPVLTWPPERSLRLFPLRQAEIAR